MSITQKSKITWLALLLVTAGIVHAATQTLITREILLDEFGQYLDDETAYEMAEKSLTMSRQLVKIGFTLTLLLLKVILFTGIIWSGLLFLKTTFTLSELLEIVVKSYFVFFLLDITKFIWFSFFETDYTFSRLNTFNPFSAGFIVAELFPSTNNAFIKIISRIELPDFFFCFAVTHQLIQINTGLASTLLYRAVFFSYFTMIIGFAVVRIIISTTL
jgi:hypothetical protein